MVADSSFLIWATFIVVHLWVAYVGLGLTPGQSYGDVELYRYWVASGLDGRWPVTTPGWDYSEWVYPFGAIVPMLLAGMPLLASSVIADGSAAVSSSIGYQLGWVALVTILDAIGVYLLLKLPRGRRAVWWFFAFCVALGPVWMGRLDGVASALALIALAIAARHPKVATVIITIGAWIKVSPGVYIIPLFVGAARRVRDVVIPAAITCAVVVLAVVALGGTSRIASFLTAQDSRGLQVEAIGATPYLLARLFGAEGILVEYDTVLFTFQVIAEHTMTVGAVLSAGLYLAVAVIAVLLWFGRQHGGNVLMWGALALTTALIIFNRVGSPQYQVWLAAPIAVALAAKRPSRSWTWVSLIALVIAAITQWMYPFQYGAFLAGDAWLVVGATVRNILVIALFVLALVRLVHAVRHPAAALGTLDGDDAKLSS